MDVLTDDRGRDWQIVAEVALAEINDPQVRAAWERQGVLARLELDGAAGSRTALLKESGCLEILETGASIPNGRRRRNPEAGAVELAEEWYGRPAETVTEIVEDEHFHEWLADLGRLVEFEIAPYTGRRPTKVIPLEFDAAEDVRLGSNELGDQLFIKGQISLSDATLKRLGVPESQWNRESVVLGEAVAVVYHAAKHTNAHKAATYRHAFGEDGGELPLLVWKPLNRRLELSGGSYTVESPGIIN